MIKVGIIGGSGYTGGELLRILLNHPQVEIDKVTSERFAGQPVSLVHPNLRNQGDLRFTSIKKLDSCELLFIALPNGKSMEIMTELKGKTAKIIDLGADFRLRSAGGWTRWYGTKHQVPELLNEFIYGVPELHRRKLNDASCVAGPGCEAIVSILSLWPLVKHKAIDSRRIIIDAKMGSSQAGNKSSSASHHPERSGVVRSYIPTGHRHTAEIEQELNAGGDEVKVGISATAVEMVRGVLVTIHTWLKNDLSEKDIWRIYREEYGNEPFIRIVKHRHGLYRLPEPKILQGTNFCEIGFERDEQNSRLVIIGAIDNLGKGAAGNAVQCMNLMSGFEETLGLEFPGLHPI